MSYTEHRPHAASGNSIACIWTLDGRTPDAASPCERIIPDGCAEIIVQCADTMRLVDADDRTIEHQPRAFVVGALSQGWALRANGRVRTIGIRIRPHAIAEVFGDSADRFVDRATPLDAVFGRRAREFVDRLVSSPNDGQMVDVAREFVVPLDRPHSRRSDRARDLVGAVLLSRGRRTIKEIAGRLLIGKKTAERIFRDEVGIPAKTLARIARFQALLERLRSGMPFNFAEVAAKFGYYDQAHLVRDFKAFAGRTPSRFIADEGIFATCYSRPENAADSTANVAFFQDAPATFI